MNTKQAQTTSRQKKRVLTSAQASLCITGVQADLSTPNGKPLGFCTKRVPRVREAGTEVFIAATNEPPELLLRPVRRRAAATQDVLVILGAFWSATSFAGSWSMLVGDRPRSAATHPWLPFAQVAHVARRAHDAHVVAHSLSQLKRDATQ